ncbi:hypothetical protein [Methanosphaerula subterraneus]|uniref:hypothetical protein n=1 Tax=Methanosphaerula subterraneus TaxID=3350244 RepID=UPI003F876B5F
MICQIFRLNRPTCRTAISRKTAARTMMAMNVDQCSGCGGMSVGIWRKREMRSGLLVIGASLLIAGCVQSKPGVNSTTPAHTAGTPGAVPDDLYRARRRRPNSARQSSRSWECSE